MNTSEESQKTDFTRFSRLVLDNNYAHLSLRLHEDLRAVFLLLIDECIY